jgi:hypothetical protein
MQRTDGRTLSIQKRDITVIGGPSLRVEVDHGEDQSVATLETILFVVSLTCVFEIMSESESKRRRTMFQAITYPTRRS